MNIKDIIINQDLLIEAAKMVKGQDLADSYKWYLHLQYIKYIEGVAVFLAFAAAANNGKDTVSLKKKDLSCLSKTLFEVNTYPKF